MPVSAVNGPSGLDTAETLLLRTLGTAGARWDQPRLKSSRLLRLIEDAGLSPRVGYDLMCLLARRDVVHLRLVDLSGNPGSEDFPPADARYTEARLTVLGDHALDSAVGRGSDLPIGLVNGRMHLGGWRPPFAPRRVVEALVAASAGATDADVLSAVGPPAFATGCLVGGDIDSLLEGVPVDLELRAHLTHLTTPAGPAITITNLPPGFGSSTVTANLHGRMHGDRRGARLAVDINDHSTVDKTAITCTMAGDDAADLESMTDVIADTWGVRTVVPADLGRPIVQILRQWSDHHASADLPGRLAPLTTND